MFKIGDILIYSFLILLLLFLGVKGFGIKNENGSKIEIYVNNKLYRVEKLEKGKREFDVPTELGGIKVLLEDEKVRVLSSNSPKKIIVKQGFVSRAGESLIGVPDKVLIKVIGETDLDYVIK